MPTYSPRRAVYSEHEPADYGFTSKEMQDAMRKYVQHRAHSKGRNIKLELTFDEWISIWVESGHWAERGYRHGQYVMSRYGDEGNYSIGNVFIQTAGENSAQAKFDSDKLREIQARPEIKQIKSIAAKKYIEDVKQNGQNPYTPKACTIDGINIYPSRYALQHALGAGKDGTRNPGYCRTNLPPNKPDIRKKK